MDLPEGGKLKKLVVPPASPLRPIGSAALSQQPDSSAALQEALAHGDTVPALDLSSWLLTFTAYTMSYDVHA